MGAGLFLGDQDRLGEGLFQTGGNQGIRSLVSLGHRAVVGFDLNVEIVGIVDLHDLVPRFEGKATHHGFKLFVIQNVLLWQPRCGALGVNC